MAVFGVSITKETQYRGVLERFANVYHYRTLVGEPFLDGAVIDALVAAERPVMGTAVNFVEARTWGPVGDPATSITRETRTLQGSGTKVGNDVLHSEARVLVQFEMSERNVRGRLVYLRKYLRPQSTSSGPGAARGAVAMNAAEIGLYRTYGSSVKRLTGGPFGAVAYDLCEPDGSFEAGDPQVDPFIGTRQFAGRGKYPRGAGVNPGGG